MSLSVALQMDPIDVIDIAGDSTFALALEAQARGHRLYVEGDWSLGRVSACARDGELLKAAANPRLMQGYAAGR